MIDWLDKFFLPATVKANVQIYIMGIFLSAAMAGTCISLMTTVSGWFILLIIVFSLIAAGFCAAVDIALYD